MRKETKDIIHNFLLKIADKLPVLLRKFLIIFIAVFILFVVVLITTNVEFSKKVKGQCIEADEFGTKKNIIPAIADDEETGYYTNKSYKHEQIRQTIVHTDLGLYLNGDPLIINITGEWIPWLSGNDSDSINNTNFILENGGLPDKRFFCALEKYTIKNNRVSNKEEENEFYYVKNYYKGIKEETLSKDTTINGKDLKKGTKVTYGIEELPERQKECWITRGAGLYLGSYGINGKTQPSAYHHLIASKMLCSKTNWFDGNISSPNDVITKYTESGKEKKYTYRDFLENYFSLSYHLDKDFDNDTTYNIIDISGNQVIYNIDLHEKLLYENKIDNVGYIIAASMEKFANACYKESKDTDGNLVRNYKSYFQFGPKTLYKNVSSELGIKYSYGEKIKMFIADKYYNDNNGFYNIEIVSGVDLDDTGYIEGKIQEVEFYLLGTPNPGQANDRTDGIVAKLFNSILKSNFMTLVRVLMTLSVVFFGYQVIFGKFDKLSNRKELMKMMFKFGIIILLTSDTAFQFFNKTVINFFINGTIGIIDMISSVFSNSFMDNTISLIGGLQYSNEKMSLARNFAIIDEILAFFDGYAVTGKIMSFFFNFGQAFLIGCFLSIMIFLVIIFYVFTLMKQIIPFIFTLLELTVVLPLIPFIIVFGLFDKTKKFVSNWISFILSKCLELITFFTGFYFCTSIIDNFIKKLLSFKVCFVPLGDYLMPNVDDSVGVDGVKDFINFNWLSELVKKILNNFVAFQQEGTADNYLMFYCINILIIGALVYLFDSITNQVVEIIGSIININGTSASKGDLTSSNKPGLEGRVSNLLKNTGLADIQKNVGALSWTRNFVDLSSDKLVTNSMKNITDKAISSANKFTDAAAQAWTDKSRGNQSNFGNDMKQLAGSLVNDFTKDSQNEDGEPSLMSLITGDRSDPNTWGKNEANSSDEIKFNKNNLKEKEDTKFEKVLNRILGKTDEELKKEEKSGNKDNFNEKIDDETLKDVSKTLSEVGELENLEDIKYNEIKEKELRNKFGNEIVDIMLLINRAKEFEIINDEKYKELMDLTAKSMRHSDKISKDERMLLIEQLKEQLGNEVIASTFVELVKQEKLDLVIRDNLKIEKDQLASSLLNEDSTSLLSDNNSVLLKGDSTKLLKGDSSVLLTSEVSKMVVDKLKERKINKDNVKKPKVVTDDNKVE